MEMDGDEYDGSGEYCDCCCPGSGDGAGAGSGGHRSCGTADWLVSR